MWTKNDLRERINSNASLRSKNPHIATPLSNTNTQSLVQHESVGKTEGGQKSQGRIQVRITAFRNRLLDPCNFTGKALVDCLRYAGAIRDDSLEFIEVIEIQKKVPSRKDEMTLIELFEIQ
jgi:hypothetical protein